MTTRTRNRNGRRFRREPRLKLSRRGQAAVRVACFFVVPVLALVLFPLSRSPKIEPVSEGQISQHEIIAPFDFPVKKDPEVLEQERRAAAEAVPPVLDVDPTVVVAVQEKLTFVERVLMSPPAGQLPTDDFRVSVERKLGIRLAAETVETLKGESGASLFQAARDELAALLSRAVVPVEVSVALANREVVVLRKGGTDFPKTAATAVITVDAARRELEEATRRRFPRDAAARRALVELVGPLLAPNAVYAQEETRRRIAAARAEVPVITHVISKGLRIIDSHQRVTAEHVRIIGSMIEYQEEHLLAGPVGGTLVRNLGRCGALCLLLLALVIYLRVQQPALYHDLRSLGVLVALGVLAVALASVFIVQLGLPEMLVPLAAVPLLAAFLLQRGVALFLALMAPFLFMILTIPGGRNLSPQFLIGSSVAGVAAVLAAGNIKKRYEIYWPVILVGAAYVLVSLALGMALQQPVRQVMQAGGEGALSAFLAGALTMVTLPIFERLFRITTNFTLLELLDRNHPLLQRMSIEAPGTFHHSMMVSELAREAVAQIGGNALLAQVGAYYHDIGKMVKPQYFIENQTGFNAHDKLTPTMSCLVLGSHVREGVLMAREAGLPREIIDFIPEHHGTTLMSYFYHKAKESDEHLDESDFRYPGPRPGSKETAVVMLADSAEATARSLDDPTPGMLRAVVTRLIAARAADGQLDSSALTMFDLARVREAFITVLQRFFHRRIQYPGQRELGGRRVENGRRPQTQTQTRLQTQTGSQIELKAAPQGEEAPRRRRERRAPGSAASPAADGTELVVAPPSGKAEDAHPSGEPPAAD